MKLYFSKNLYPLEAIRNTIYWFSSRYDLTLNETGDDFYVICSNSDDSFVIDFNKSLNDFVLRHQIDEKSKDIKALVTAKAFYPELVRFKDIGKFEDPIDLLKNNNGT